MTVFAVTQLRIGRVEPIGSSQTLSGIAKKPVTGQIMARLDGFDGDEQADRKHHGGRNKALHAYPAKYYQSWKEDLPDYASRFQPGAFGENLVIEGATETDLCLFDRFRLGAAELEISQTRQPCWKLNLRFDLPDMARRVQESGRTGWYFRVIREGAIAPGDKAQLIARPAPDWPLVRVWRLLYRDTLDYAALVEFAALPDLPENWQRMIATRLKRGAVEDWEQRLAGQG